MKKRYFKTSWDSLLLQAIILLGLGGTVYVLVQSIRMTLPHLAPENRWSGVLLLFILSFGLALLAYLEATFWVGAITLEEKCIRTRGDIRLPNEKIQYKASVDYERILEVSIIPLRRDSKNRNVRASRPFPYLCVTKARGRTLFALHFMSSATVRSMLTELNKRCLAAGNDIAMDVDKLMSDFSKARWATKE